MMSGTTTLQKIRRHAERRQALWSKMSSLTADDRAVILRLTRELEALWEQHRAELLKPSRNPRRASKTALSSPHRNSAA